MSNITDKGWESDSVDTIVNETATALGLATGQDIPITPDSFIGQFLNVLAEREKKIQDLGQAVTDTQNLSTCHGIYLDYIAEHKNTRRLAAAGSYGKLNIKGKQATVINENTPFQDDLGRVVLTEEYIEVNRASCYTCDFTITQLADNTEYLIIVEGADYSYTSGTGATEESVLQGLGAILGTGSAVFTHEILDGNICITSITPNNILTVNNSPSLTLEAIGMLVEATAVQTGALIFSEDSITEIVDSNLGVISVSNPRSFVVGRFIEEDPELRARLESIGTSAGVATIPAMQASLSELEGVTNVFIRDNKTDFTSATGIPARHFETFVVGGEEQAVGELLYSIQPAGISTHGDITILFDDINGDPQSSSFSRKTSMVSWIEISYTINSEEAFPSTGEDAIRAAVIAFGEAMYSGEDLVANKFYAPCYSVEGVIIDSIRAAVTEGTGDVPTYTTDRIPVSVVEDLVFHPDNITFV